ncbi:MAG: guanylate kinase [Tenacibaculum sp.]
MSKGFQGKLIVFSAPSGSGKTTIVRHLLAQVRFNLEFSISATSRSPRANEKDGTDYYFISVESFKKKIKNQEFLEWEEVYKNSFYGTLKSEVQRIWNKNKHIIFDVDVAGGLKIKNKFPHQTLSVFIKPPNVDELVKRLHKRGQDSKEKIAKRMAKAPVEFTKVLEFDKVIKNYNLQLALQEAENTIDEFLASKPR